MAHIGLGVWENVPPSAPSWAPPSCTCGRLPGGLASGPCPRPSRPPFHGHPDRTWAPRPLRPETHPPPSGSSTHMGQVGARAGWASPRSSAILGRSPAIPAYSPPVRPNTPVGHLFARPRARRVLGGALLRLSRPIKALCIACATPHTNKKGLSTSAMAIKGHIYSLEPFTSLHEVGEASNCLVGRGQPNS